MKHKNEKHTTTMIALPWRLIAATIGTALSAFVMHGCSSEYRSSVDGLTSYERMIARPVATDYGYHVCKGSH